jgi:hypothetical protein
MKRYEDGKWRTTTVAALPGMNISALAAVCNRAHCLTAIETDPVWSRTEPFELAVYWHQMTQPRRWQRVWHLRLPTEVGAGQVLLAQSGRLAWILVDGTPSAGQMPKVMYFSQDGGMTWKTFATYGIVRADGVSLPAGYPTGLTAVAQNRVILTLQPSTSSTLAVSYTLDPNTVRSLKIPAPINVQWTGALPALVDGSALTIPLLGVAQEAKSVFVIATRKSNARRWTLHPVTALTEAVSAISSGNIDVLAGATHLHVVDPSGHVRILPELKSFLKPLVTAVEGSDLVVLGKGQSLWVDTETGWRQWS